MKHVALIGLSAIALFVAVGSASASTVTVTYTGVLNAVSGPHDEFGAIDLLNLQSYDITARFTFDLGAGVITRSAIKEQNFFQGETGYTTPAIAASVTINGITRALLGTDIGNIEGYNNGSIGYSRAQAAVNFKTNLAAYDYTTAGTIPKSISDAFVHSVDGNDYLQGLSFQDYVTGSAYNGVIRSFSIVPETEVAAVPLPSGLPLFGAALLGLAMVRGRAKAPSPAA